MDTTLGKDTSDRPGEQQQARRDNSASAVDEHEDDRDVEENGEIDEVEGVETAEAEGEEGDT